MTYKLSTLDIPTFRRATVGFDRLFEDLHRSIETNRGDNYPPYNSIKTGENTYVIELAVTGFSESELAVELKENVLTVTGTHGEEEETHYTPEYLHRGLARRNFVRQWTLGDHVEVKGVFVRNGVMNIQLEQIIPEEQQPKSIAITFEK